MASIKVKQILENIIKILFFGFVLYLLWGIYIVNLGYDVEMNHTIQAGLYKEEEKLEDVTIEVEGTFHNYFFQRNSYEGRFAVSCLPETINEYALAHILQYKNSIGSYSSIHYLDKSSEHQGLQFIETSGNYMIVFLDKDMTEIVWETNDGKYIATPVAYESWLLKQNA